MHKLAIGEVGTIYTFKDSDVGAADLLSQTVFYKAGTTAPIASDETVGKHEATITGKLGHVPRQSS